MNWIIYKVCSTHWLANPIYHHAFWLWSWMYGTPGHMRARAEYDAKMTAQAIRNRSLTGSRSVQQ